LFFYTKQQNDDFLNEKDEGKKKEPQRMRLLQNTPLRGHGVATINCYSFSAFLASNSACSLSICSFNASTSCLLAKPKRDSALFNRSSKAFSIFSMVSPEWRRTFSRSSSTFASAERVLVSK